MEKKKNILFIMSDDHASNAISLYGSRLAGVMQTPNIDRIGKEGTWLLLHQCGVYAQPGIHTHRSVFSYKRCQNPV